MSTFLPRNYAGERFGLLTAVEPTPLRTKSGSIVWVLRCDCDRIRYAVPAALVRKVTDGCAPSCGCLRRRRRVLRHVRQTFELDGCLYSLEDMRDLEEDVMADLISQLGPLSEPVFPRHGVPEFKPTWHEERAA